MRCGEQVISFPSKLFIPQFLLYNHFCGGSLQILKVRKKDKRKKKRKKTLVIRTACMEDDQVSAKCQDEVIAQRAGWIKTDSSLFWDFINCPGFSAKHSVNTGLPVADRWTVGGTSQLVLVFLPTRFKPGAAISHANAPAATRSFNSSLWLITRKWSDGNQMGASRRNRNSARVGASLAIPA